MKDRQQILDQAKSCTECELCMDVCPTYKITDEVLFSPMHRLKTAIKLFEGEEVSPRMVESLYNCTECMRCDDVCPLDIKITEIVANSRIELVKKGLGPLDRQNKIIKGILTQGNSVNGDPKRRLDWLPEEFPRRQSDTLLYIGCLASYLVKDAAASSYLVLKKLGLDFMILEDEGCCGVYLYESGKIDLAGELFQKNVERLKSLGIRKLIVPCNGCQQCFKHLYPEVLGEFDFEVRHIVEAIHELLKENQKVLKKIQRTVTYQDSCRLARREGVTEEPRDILSWCGAELKEMKENRREVPCCGSGGGVRSVYRDLSLEMAINLLGAAETDSVVTACPFCAFNLSYASRKKELGKNIIYFTELVLNSLK